ncbi:hypothetical protein P3G55_07745 [Leptospira sp. 96542]|nr:hypothetical protein [Leptospira sp. 96542]
MKFRTLCNISGGKIQFKNGMNKPYEHEKKIFNGNDLLICISLQHFETKTNNYGMKMEPILWHFMIRSSVFIELIMGHYQPIKLEIYKILILKSS